MQGNILVTHEGQACLGDFGISGVFRGLTHHYLALETLRHVAPERFSGDISGEIINGPSKQSDIYSFATTSFEVCSSAVNYPSAQYNYHVTIRSSQGYCLTMAVIGLMSSPISDLGNNHPAQWTKVRRNCYRTLFGMQSQPVGVVDLNNGMSSLLYIKYFQSLVNRGPNKVIQAKQQKLYNS